MLDRGAGVTTIGRALGLSGSATRRHVDQAKCAS